MATPYRVPSIEDIIYSRSRVPSPGQQTLNTLLELVRDYQEEKADSEERQEGRDFTIARDEADKEFREEQITIRRQREDDKFAIERIQRGSDRRRAEKIRREEKTDRRIELNLDFMDSLIDEKNWTAAEGAKRVIETDFGKTNTDYSVTLNILSEKLTGAKKKSGNEKLARSAANKYSFGEMSIDEVLNDTNFEAYASDKDWSRVLDRNLLELERNNKISDVKRKRGLDLLEDEYTSARENWIATSTLGDAEDRERAYNYYEMMKGNYLSEISQLTSDKGGNGVIKDGNGAIKNPLSEQKVTDVDDAIPLWIDYNASVGQKVFQMESASDKNVAAIKSRIESGDLIPIYENGGVKDIVTQEQAARAGAMNFIDPSKLEYATIEETPTVEQVLKDMDSSFQAKSASGKLSEGVGKIQKMSADGTISKGAVLHVPENVRTYYGMFREITKQLGNAAGDIRNHAWIYNTNKERIDKGLGGSRAQKRFSQSKKILDNAVATKEWGQENLLSLLKGLDEEIQKTEDKKLIKLRANIARYIETLSSPKWYRR